MSEGSETILRKTPLFANLTEPEIHALAARVTKRRFQRGELLLAKVTPAQDFSS